MHVPKSIASMIEITTPRLSKHLRNWFGPGPISRGVFGDVSQSALKPIASELECCHSRKPIQAAHYVPSHCYSHPKPQPRSSLHHLAQEVLEGWLGFLGYALHITVVALKKVSPTDFRMQCLEYCLQHHLWNTYSNLQLPCELSESFPKFRKLAYAGSANLPYISHRWLM